MYEVLIALRSVGPARVVVATTMAQPQVGRKITHPEALALDMINHAKHQPNCGRVEWEQALTDEDGKAALGLAKDLVDPEMYGFAVTPEIRNAARRVLGVKYREGLAA